jgi:hypothetical protein
MKKTNVILGVLFLSVGFTALSQKKGTGLLRDDAGYKSIPMIEKPLGFGDNLPSSYSLMDYVPSQIADQGSLQTCAGWASTYYLATMEYAIAKKIKDKNVINSLVYDPLDSYNAFSVKIDGKDEGCQNGSGMNTLADWMVNNDVKRLNIDPASCGSSKGDFKGSVLDFTDCNRLFDQFTDMEEQITATCQSLVNNHPVLIGIFPPDTFMEVGSDGIFNSGGLPYNSNNGHAMCVIGYDDNKLGGCFIVANSWGGSWGDKGFVYIKYQDFFNYAMYGISFETEVKTISTTTVGCASGDCNSGYGVSLLKKKTTGLFEGFFADGKPYEGIYTVYSGVPTKGDVKLMKKLIKKNSGQAIYSNSTMIGVIID